MAPITIKNTSTGATPFRAFTNRLPSITIPETLSPRVRARIIPMISPMIICLTRLRLFQNLTAFFVRNFYYIVFAFVKHIKFIIYSDMFIF